MRIVRCCAKFLVSVCQGALRGPKSHGDKRSESASTRLCTLWASASTLRSIVQRPEKRAIYTRPWACRLLAVSRMVSGTGRVVQPSSRLALSEETERRFPSSKSRVRKTGSNTANRRTKKSGMEMDGTLRALSPSPCLRIFAMSLIQ